MTDKTTYPGFLNMECVPGKLFQPERIIFLFVLHFFINIIEFI